MSEEWLIALGLVLVLEGLLPTLAPKSWKKMVSDLASRPDGQLRAVGLVVMMVGLAWIFIVI